MCIVHFNLKTPSKQKSLLVMKFYFNHFEIKNGKRIHKYLKFSTGIYLPVVAWNKNREEARNVKDYLDSVTTNKYLDDLRLNIKTIYRKLVSNDEPISPDILRSKLLECLENSNSISIKKKIKTLIEYGNDFINDAKTGKYLTLKKGKISDNTIKKYQSTLNTLNEYQIKRNKVLFFESINMDFYYDLYDWVIFDTGRQLNTFGGYIKIIKVIMNHGLSKKWHSNISHKDKQFVTIQEDVDNIYLNEQEIQKIYELDLEQNSKLNSIRDFFVIGCSTGLRYSDLHQLNPKFHLRNNLLYIKTEKTSKKVTIPIHWRVAEILNKYNNILPQITNNQDMNENIKVICEMAGLTEPVLINETVFGVKTDVEYKKYQLCSCHTSRRSFATNAYLAKIPSFAIMLITSHVTEKSFLKYIKIKSEENAFEYANHSFFQKPISSGAEL